MFLIGLFFWILEVFEPLKSKFSGKIQNFSTILENYALVDVPRLILERTLCEEKLEDWVFVNLGHLES